MADLSDDRARLRARLDAMTPAERAAVRSYAADQLLKMRRVKVGGKVLNLKQLRDKALRMKGDFDNGVYDESIRTVPRWQMQEHAPTTSLRPGAQKQLLRRDEEQRLQLDRIAQGAVYSSDCNALDRALQRVNPLHKREFAWGMFARPEQAECALASAWAGVEPASALTNSQFYADVLRHAHQMELTLMLLTARPIPLKPLREALTLELRQRAELLQPAQQPGGQGGASAEDPDLGRFIRLWDDERLEPCSWVDKGAIREGTHLLLSAAPNGTLVVEAISPGNLRDRTTSIVATTRSQAVSAAVLSALLGPRPLDPGARHAIGHGLLWCANGGRFRLGAGDPAVQHLAADVDAPGGAAARMPAPEGEVLAASPSLFGLVNGPARSVSRMLLQGVQQAQLALEA